jgi:hypothetical protein
MDFGVGNPEGEGEAVEDFSRVAVLGLGARVAVLELVDRAAVLGDLNRVALLGLRERGRFLDSGFSDLGRPFGSASAGVGSAGEPDFANVRRM